MNEQTLSIEEVQALIKRNIAQFLILLAIPIVCSVILLLILPDRYKQYKSKSIVSIESSYFRNSLVSDLIPDSDATELEAKRMTLLRLALDETFLDETIQKYNLYSRITSDVGDVVATKRDILLKNIEYFSVGKNTIQLSVTGNDPAKVSDINKDVLNRVTAFFASERMRSLDRALRAISTQMDSLSEYLRAVPGEGNQLGSLQAQLNKVQASLASLRSRYTDSHPEVSRLLMQKNALQKQVAGQSEGPSVLQNIPEDYAKALMVPGSKMPAQDIYNDLFKKLSYLKVVIDMEDKTDSSPYIAVVEGPKKPTEPVFPNPRIFLMVGSILGLLTGAIKVIYTELKRSITVTPLKGSEILGVPLFGELPALPLQAQTLLIAGPDNLRRNILPMPEPKDDNKAA